MNLSIKKPEAQAVAKELSVLTGENVTEAVTVALRERLERLQKEKDVNALVEWVMEMARDTAARLGDRCLIDHAELLYDERGLPK
jgi:antitoxin VapB